MLPQTRAYSAQLEAFDHVMQHIVLRDTRTLQVSLSLQNLHVCGYVKPPSYIDVLALKQTIS